MQLEEIKTINKVAGKSKDLESAALKHLGLESAAGSEAAVNGIVDEVRQYNEADKKTRAGIEAYKAAKTRALDGEDAADAEDPE